MAALVPAVLGAAALVTAPAHAEPALPPSGEVAPLIVGGRPATQQYPFTASLQQYGRHGCGASLVAPRWLVTAAHCVTGGLQARIGSNDHTSGGELVQVAQSIRHPRYNGQAGPYDIAVMRLASAVRSQPVTIAGSSPAPGTGVRLLGWGQECPNPQCGPAPRNLKELDTRINPDSMCRTGYDPSIELCVFGNATSGTACYGDSGGPLLVNGQLAGATSRAGANSPTCGTGDATVYTDVTAHRQWISQATGGAVR
ncbi:serine protease [Saccharopolyspora taberi]|uniref:Serine protease n=1 Tax=Saccharopolyspora taberi TaxID=60895 RepID=A0ABN3VAM2_9PSEU